MLLTLQQVSKKTTFSKSTIYRLVRTGTFPEPIKLSIRRVAWQESEIDNFIARCQKSSAAKD